MNPRKKGSFAATGIAQEEYTDYRTLSLLHEVHRLEATSLQLLLLISNGGVLRSSQTLACDKYVWLKDMMKGQALLHGQPYFFVPVMGNHLSPELPAPFPSRT